MTESSMAAIHIEGYPPPAGAVPVVAGGQPTNQQRYYMWGPPPPYSNPNSPARSAANNPPPPAPGGAQPLLSLLAPGSGAATGAASQGSGVTPTGSVSPRYHHFQHHHHLHHHHHHCQLQAQQQQQQQQLQTQGAQTLTQGEVLVGGTGLLKHLQQQRNRTCPQGGLRRFPEGSGHCFEDVSSSSGDVASSDCKNTSTSVENYMNASEAELASADISETNTDSSGSPGAPAAYPSAGNLQGMFSPGQRDSKMSIEEEFHHNGEDSNGNPAGSHSHYMSGITNTAFQDQEGQASSKSDQTESEVYFADVSSCCNVSVRNDGQDSSLYDEAVDPQKRLMILNRDGRNRVTGIPPGGQFPAHHHDHHSHHHPLLGTENSMMNCVGNEDAQVSGGCFSYPRQGSCNRMPYALVRHPMETVEDRMCGQVCSRDYLGQVTKDPSVSSGNGTPLTETASPMSVSTSSPSPGSYPPEGIVNCVTFYREGTVLVGEKDSTNMCSGTDMYPPVHKPSQGQTQQRNVEYSDNHFLAPDAQYETISSQPQQYPCHLQKVFAGREDFNGNTPPNSPGRGKVMTSSPSRRHLNLPLHITTTGGTTNNSNIIENLYHTATSTEEEELDHQQQYSDATMDSGCHSGSEFAARHLRAPASGTPGSTGAKMSDEEEEQQSTGSNVQVTNMRSVNV
ncbi:Uncharacterized protein GBIM_06603 [Gryllus bimaculatus]|nr:Uncharacterized protein GBIM_06603 [Gryllus bimaculatus]